MLSTLCFIPKGAAKEVPEQYELSKAEIDMLVEQQSGMSLEESSTAAAGAGAGADAMDADDVESDDAEDASDDHAGPADSSMDAKETRATPAGANAVEEAFLKEINIDGYDDEEDGPELFLGGKKLTLHGSNADDPYITVGDDADASEGELEDLMVLPTDNIIVVGSTEEEHSSLEAQVYDEIKGALYVHHDIALPSFPLCTAWLNCNPSATAEEKTGSFVAVGTFEPGIEIWNMDVLDALEPSAILGGRHAPTGPVTLGSAAGKKKGKSKPKMTAKLKEQLLGEFKAGSHRDAVLCLGWHHAHASRLASGSADKLVKIWDIVTQQCTADFTHHKDKVQSLEWNPREPSILVTGSFDRTIAILDHRNPSAVHRVQADADLECVRWSPHNGAIFAASTEKGTVFCHDVRMQGRPLFTLAAHDKATSSISFNAFIPDLLATASLDKTVKLWDLTDNRPSCVLSKEMKVGQLYCMQWNPSSPFTLACGGNKGKLALWDLSTEDAIKQRFNKAQAANRAAAPAPAAAAAAPMADAPASSQPAPAAASAAGSKGKSKGGKPRKS